MRFLKKRILSLALAGSLFPALALAADVSFTWDGNYLRDPNSVPAAFPSPSPGPAPDPTYAKLVVKAATDCALVTPDDSTKLGFWEHQPSHYSWLMADNFDCVTEPGRVCQNAGLAQVDNANASISFDAYVNPGAAYAISGTQICYIQDDKGWRCGGNAAQFPRCHAWSAKVEVPPVLNGVTISSKKQAKYFNTFKVGAALHLSNVAADLPETTSSYLLPIKQTLIVEGPGIPQAEYDLANWDHRDSLAVLTPTSAGTMRFKVRTQGYTYYMDHWHGGALEDWSKHDWNKQFPNPTYTEERLDSDEKCDKIFNEHQPDDPDDDEKCPGFGQPKFHAELFSLESEWIEIPVTDDWCLIKTRTPSFPAWKKSAIPSEGCHSCSSKYSEERNLWDPDPCATSTEEDGDDPSEGGTDPDDAGTSGGSGTSDKEDDSSSGCSATGAGFVSCGILCALFPALRRRRNQQ